MSKIALKAKDNPKMRFTSLAHLLTPEPYLAVVLSDGIERKLEEIEKVLQIPRSIWNATVIEKITMNHVDYMKTIKSSIQNMPVQIKTMIEDLKVRKKKYFDQYNYLLGEYSLYMDDKSQGVRLKVEARSTDHLS